MPDNQDFRLKYVGARFNGGRLPLDVLSDLPAFRDLLVAFAKDGWREANAKRKRVPKGFDKSIALDLVAIEDGSAVPLLKWNRNVAQANLPGFSDRLEEIVTKSFGEIIELINLAGTGRFPESLSVDHIRALNKLGSGLRDDERIEFPGTESADGNVVYLDAYRRRELITHVKETYQRRYESIGRLVTNNAEGSITVQTEDFGAITLPVDPDEVKATYDGNLNADVQFDIQIELDHHERYRSVVDVFDVALIDAQIGADLMRCRARLNELSALMPGWHNGTGKGVTSEAIDAANRFLSRRPGLAGVYRIYPTEEGGVLFEFDSTTWDLSVEFAPDGGVELYGVQIEGMDELEPVGFPAANEEFMALFDARVDR